MILLIDTAVTHQGPDESLTGQDTGQKHETGPPGAFISKASPVLHLTHFGHACSFMLMMLTITAPCI